MRLIERLLARATGNPRIAEAVVGDFEEERPRWRALRLVALALYFAVSRPWRRGTPSVPGSKPMSNLFQDLRYAGRVLLRQPGFSLVVVLTFAVGLGANASVFAMIDGMLFRPLPTADVEDMVEIFTTNVAQQTNRGDVSPADLFDWQQRTKSFERFLAIEWWDANLSDRDHDPERVVARRVSAAFFDTLLVRLGSGRAFTAGEEQAGANRIVVVSHRLWQRRWAGSTALLGSTIAIDREPYTVVGIAPEGFDYPTGAELWSPIVITSADRENRARRYLEVVARLAPGTTIERARAEMETLAARLATEHPDTNAGYGVNLMPLSLAMLDTGTPAALAVLQVVVALVLLIAGANVANLLMVRGAARHRELAVRLAVGASRWRIIRQLMVEALVLSAAGVALAIPFAAGGVRAIKSFMPPEIARWILGWGEIDVDGRLLGATMAVGLVMGGLFGALPALRASRPDVTTALKEGARGSGGRRRVLEAFVVGQVALALALLVSAGLAMRGAVTLLWQYDGYDPHGVMTFAVTLPESGYADAAARRRFVDRVLERVRTLPQVERAAFSNTVPFSDGNSGRPVDVDGRTLSKASERPMVDARFVTPDYLQVLRARIVRGRDFTDADRAGAPLVALVDEMMANQLWPGRAAVGQRFRPATTTDTSWLTVVGIVSNVKHSWWGGYSPTYYVPWAQTPRESGVLAIRVRGEETAIAPAVRQMVREIDPHLPLARVHSLVRWRSLKTVGIQFIAGLVAAFAGIGLFLSAIGIYGVMAYSVSQRTREIGVRMALGATAREVMTMTLRNAVWLAGLGIVIGLVAAFGLGKLLVANLFGVVQLDVITFVVFAVVLALVAVVASSVPARRAMRVDPIHALRTE